MALLDEQLVPVAQVTIVGTGLLGGSIGLALRRAGYPGRIVGVGRSPGTLAAALGAGCVDAASTQLEEVLAEAGDQPHLLILCTPIGLFSDMLQRLAPRQRPGLIITDVGSTKQHVCDEAHRLLPQPGRFVGSHPMAGSERRGPEAASDMLFAGRPCVVTPDCDTDPQARGVVEALWRTLGMRVLTMTPQEHDRCVARVSHLPHALAALLVAAAVEEGGMEVASTGFRDCTRVASGDPTLWLDIFATNRAAVADAVDSLMQRLARFRAAVAAGDEAAIGDLLRSAKQQRDQWLHSFEQRRQESSCP